MISPVKIWYARGGNKVSNTIQSLSPWSTTVRSRSLSPAQQIQLRPGARLLHDPVFMIGSTSCHSFSIPSATFVAGVWVADVNPWFPGARTTQNQARRQIFNMSLHNLSCFLHLNPAAKKIKCLIVWQVGKQSRKWWKRHFFYLLLPSQECLFCIKNICSS